MTAFQLDSNPIGQTAQPSASTGDRISDAAAQPASELDQSSAAAYSTFGTALSKADIRQSLRASSLDGTLSSTFENVVKGVLISNFLLGLGAGAFEIGLLTSIPMVAHLLQPMGAYLSEKTTSRHLYCLWVYGTARLLWLLPAGGIFLYSHGQLSAHWLTMLTLGVLALSNVLDSIGCASWMSWMATLVPQKLRGRYFSLRRSLYSLAALLTIPLGGTLISRWMGGEIEGYGVALIIAVALGIVSLCFQFWMSDVNPQAEALLQQKIQEKDCAIPQSSGSAIGPSPTDTADTSAAGNFTMLLCFLGLWTFGLNISAPFFNFYLLDSLQLDVQSVTIYGGLVQGAYFFAIFFWGRLADRWGNRPVLMLNGLLMGSLPLLWLFTSSSPSALWLGLPLLHTAQGATFAALELCLANIQMELAPRIRQSHYFAIAAALMGIAGALGTTLGSTLAEQLTLGLPIVFALSALVRLLSLLPLSLVNEPRSQSIRQLLRAVLGRDWGVSQRAVPVLSEGKSLV